MQQAEVPLKVASSTRVPFGEGDIGTDNPGIEGAINGLVFIFRNLPYDEPTYAQMAYILWAVMRAQIFNNGNKWTAVALTLVLAQDQGWRLVAPDEELYEFILRRFGEGPRWPMEEVDILARDRLFHYIARWLVARVDGD